MFQGRRAVTRVNRCLIACKTSTPLASYCGTSRKKPESAGERWQNGSSQIVRRIVKPHLRSQVLQAISRIFCGVSGRRVIGAAVIFFRTFDAVVTQGVTLTWNGYCRSGDRRAGVTGMRQKPRFKKTEPSTQRQGGKSRQSSQRRCA